MIICKR